MIGPRVASGGRTAFIDLIFILLAFVVVASGVRKGPPEDRRNRELHLELPVLGASAARPDPREEPRLTVLLREDGRVFVGRSRVPVVGDREFREAVRRAADRNGGGTVVQIDADGRAPLEAALRVVELLRLEGLHRILFLATTPGPEREG